MRGAWPFALLMMGCGSSHAPSPAARAVPDGRLPPEEALGTSVEGGTLTVLVPAEPAHLLRLVEADFAILTMTIPNVYETLIWGVPGDETRLLLAPRLAESWDASADGQTYTFVLREGVRWHDGAPLTADDVIFTFDLVMDPKGRSGHVRSSLTDLLAWEKVDERTVRFRFAKPYFLSLRTLGTVQIIPRHVFGTGDLAKHPNLRRPIGTGPFRFESWENKRIAFRRNDDYWGAKAHVDRLVFRVVEDTTVAAQLVARGEADVYANYLPEQWLRLADDPDFLAHHWLAKDYSGRLQFVNWNERRSMFADRRVRGALARLLNRPYVEEHVFRGLYVSHECVVYFREPACDRDLKPPPYDPPAARAMLDEVGWSDHDGDGIRDKDGRPFRFTFTYTAGSTVAEQIGVVLRDELGRSGIRMDLQGLDNTSVLSRARHGEFDAVWMGNAIGTPTDPFPMFHSSQSEGFNYAAFKNAEADRLLEAGKVELDDDRRHVLYRSFGKILDAEQPRIAMGSPPTLGAVSRRVHGMSTILENQYAVMWLDPGAP